MRALGILMAALARSRSRSHAERPLVPRRKKRRVEVQYDDDQISTSWEPAKWREQFDNIVAMRRDRTAPVDAMGAEKQGGDDLPPKVRA